MQLSRRDFLKSLSATFAAVALPLPLLRKQYPNLDVKKIERYLNKLSIARHVLLRDDIFIPDCAPRYAANEHKPKGSPYSTAITRNDRLVTAEDEINVPILTNTTPREGTELEVAEKLAQIEEQLLIRLLRQGGDLAFAQKYGTPAFFNSLFRLIEQHDCLVHSVIVNKAEFEQIAVWGKDTVDIIKPIAKNPRLKGYLWTADLYESEFLPPGHTLVLSEPNTVGVMPVKQPAYVEEGEIKSQTGIALINPYLAIVGKGLFSRNPCGEVTLTPVRDCTLAGTAGGPGAE